MKIKMFSLIALALVPFISESIAREINVNIGFDPEPKYELEFSFQPILSFTDADLADIELKKKTKHVSFATQIPFEIGEIFRAFRLSLPMDVEGYFHKSIEVRLPYKSPPAAQLDYRLVAVAQEAGNRKQIRSLRDVDPNNLAIKELFEYYVKSYIHAESVVEKKPIGSNRLRRDDVRAVYSYLQSVKELSKRRHLREDEFVKEASSWLNWANRTHKNVVHGAVRIDNSRQLIDQIDHLETERYTVLWNNILKLGESDFDHYCRLIKNLQVNLLKLPEERIKKINRKNLTGLVTNAYAQCIARAIRPLTGRSYNLRFDGCRERKVILSRQISILREQVNVVREWPGLKAQVLNHIADLQNLDNC